MENILVKANENTLEIRAEDTVQAFLSYCDIKENSQKIYKKALGSFISYINEKEITEVKREDIVAYKESLRSSGLTPNTINIKIKVLKRFFQFLEYAGLYKDITKGIKLETISSGHKKDFLNTNQVKYLLDSISSERDRLIVLVASVTGLRVSEIASLTIKDLCFHHGVPAIMVLRKARAEKEPLIISMNLYCDLMNYCKGRAEGEPIFCNSRHSQPEAMTGDHISRIIKASMKNIGINSSKYTAHSLRHSAITNALLNGASLVEVQAMANHKSINTTMIYNHELEATNNKAVDLNYKALFN